MPVEYTSAAKNSVSNDPAVKECDFRYEDLLSLLEIINAINVKQIMSQCQANNVAISDCNI